MLLFSSEIQAKVLGNLSKFCLFTGTIQNEVQSMGSAPVKKRESSHLVFI